MSAITESTAMSIQEQSALATKALCHALELRDLKPTDLKYLTLALAEAAADEASRNPDFASRVRDLYSTIKPVQTRKSSPRGKKASANQIDIVELEPVGQVDERLLDPYAPPNPWALQQLYGNHQLRAALNRYSPNKLKETLPLMEERYPGTRPRNRGRKADIIDYIVEHVAGPGY